MPANILGMKRLFDPAQIEGGEFLQADHAVGYIPALIGIDEQSSLGTDQFLHGCDTIKIFFRIVPTDLDLHRLVALRQESFDLVE